MAVAGIRIRGLWEGVPAGQRGPGGNGRPAADMQDIEHRIRDQVRYFVAPLVLACRSALLRAYTGVDMLFATHATRIVEPWVVLRRASAQGSRYRVWLPDTMARDVLQIARRERRPRRRPRRRRGR